MNFNLVSPNNQSSFNAVFKDPIEIPANSKINLNWCQFKRKNKIILEADQEIIIRLDDVIPARVPSNPPTPTGSPFDAALRTIIIKAGSYTVKQLQDEIDLKILNFLSTPNPAAQFNYTSYNADNTRDDRDVNVGFNLASNNYIRFIADTRNFFNCTADGTDPTITYTKNADAGGRNVNTFDNYALSNKHYNHFNYQPEYLLTKEEYHSKFSEKINCIIAESNVSISDNTQEGLFVGLYSQEYASQVVNGVDGTISTDGARTGGLNDRTADGANLNPKLNDVNSDTGVPMCFFGVEIYGTTQANSHPNNIDIFVGTNNTDGAPRFWNGAGQTINNMVLRQSANLNDFIELNEKPTIRIYTYKDIFKFPVNDTVLDNVTHIRVEIWNNNQSKWLLVYDSHQYPATGGFGDMFFKYYEGVANNDPAAVNGQQVNASIPFNVLLAAQDQDTKWENVVYSAFDKGVDIAPAVSSNDFPKQLIRSYRWTTNSPELAKLMSLDYNATSFTSRPLFPNFFPINFKNTIGQQNIKKPILNQLNRINYSIYLENIPLNNYKNYRVKSNFGYKKNILANIPLPFGDLDEAETSDDITVNFQPSLEIVSNLNNQALKINNFQVSIKEMETDAPVTDLENSTINFTIN